MRSRAITILAGMALAACLICPMMELFDQWDNTMQTGNDTEYAVVIVALCVGVGFAAVELYGKFAAVLRLIRTSHTSTRATLGAIFPSFSVMIPLAASPPIRSLRI